jgi:threonine dehydrogenase-like Zn-dependent dehydrogenase
VKAFVITGPGHAGVQDVPAPKAEPGEVVVDVHRAGICGTDVELFTGEMQYLRDGAESYPIRIGHEWMGTVSAIGDGVNPLWLGRRVTGDTMLGCGTCARCLSSRQHTCEARTEIGIRGGRPGALGEQVPVPAWALHALPDTVDDTLGALVEPGGSALRAVQAAQLAAGDRVLVFGPGTIGLLAAMFARAAGAEVHLMGLPGRSVDFERSLGFSGTWSEKDLPDLPWDAVIDASNGPRMPAKALDLVEPGKRVVYVGLAGRASSTAGHLSCGTSRRSAYSARRPASRARSRPMPAAASTRARSSPRPCRLRQPHPCWPESARPEPAAARRCS